MHRQRIGGVAVKKWVSCELTQDEYETVKPRLAGIIFEPSGCFNLIHVEFYVDDEQLTYLKKVLEELV